MNIFYPFLIAFMLVFVSELGDKTQLLVLSFSTKRRTFSILFGVAIGSFFSHGLAILFGSQLSSLHPVFHLFLSVFTYLTFIFFGVLGFWKRYYDQKRENSPLTTQKSGFLHRFSSFRIPAVLVIAFSIMIGEIGDKTFLTSLGLGIQYPDYKLSLVFGAILGMVVSNLMAIFFGKFLGSKLHQHTIDFLSNFIFLIFGILGLLSFFLP